MSKVTFIILFAITWAATYVSVPIKFASLSTNVSADDTLKLVAIILGFIYIVMSFVTYRWGYKTNKVWLVSFPIIAGLFDVLNIPILPSILCLVTLIIGVIVSVPSSALGDNEL